jgi:hypothetical protein
LDNLDDFLGGEKAHSEPEEPIDRLQSSKQVVPLINAQRQHQPNHQQREAAGSAQKQAELPDLQRGFCGPPGHVSQRIQRTFRRQDLAGRNSSQIEPGRASDTQPHSTHRLLGGKMMEHLQAEPQFHGCQKESEQRSGNSEKRIDPERICRETINYKCRYAGCQISSGQQHQQRGTSRAALVSTRKPDPFAKTHLISFA